MQVRGGARFEDVPGPLVIGVKANGHVVAPVHSRHDSWRFLYNWDDFLYEFPTCLAAEIRYVVVTYDGRTTTFVFD